MRSNRSIPSSAVIPVLVYPDVREAVAWLQAAFGFVERVQIGENHRSQLSFGDGALIVGDVRHDRRPPRRGEETHAVVVRVDDARAHCERARAHGARIRKEPTDFEYGERQYEAEDPAGHRWIFSETLRDVAPEEWGGMTVGSARDPDVEEIAEHLRQADVLDPGELRELIPSLLILESVAVRESPPFDAEAIAALRAANQRLLDSADDPTAAALADDEFHRRLTAGCENAHLLEVVDLVRKALLGYERLYMLSPERLARSVGEHEAVVAALESGDHALAADRVRVNFTSGLPAVEAPLEDSDRP